MKFVQAVKDFALAHYDQDGWDIVIECYSDDELVEIIGIVRSEKAAIVRVKADVRRHAEYRNEVRSTEF